MSYANQKAECTPQCALWRAEEGVGGQCGLLTPADRIREGFDQLVMAAKEIKGRM
jgi:hypothetical protein